MKETLRFAFLTLAATAALAASAQLRRPQVRSQSAAPVSEKANSEARASAAGKDADEQTSDIYIPEGTDLDIAFKIYGQLVGKTVLRDPSTPDAKIKLVSLPGQKLTKEDQIAALEAAFEMNGIHMEPYGEGDDESKKFVRALPRDKARGEAIPLLIEEDAPIPDSSRVYSAMITFKNIPIDEAKTVMEGLKSPKGLLLVYERIGKILVTDTGLNINSMRKVAREIDVATPINENVFVRQIKNASATEIMEAIQKIVEESQKELEKMSKSAAQGTTVNNRPAAPSPTLLRRPGQPAQPAAPQNVESMVASVSDADRGMIRGKVIITPDERSNKLIFITSKTNMDFFDKVIEELDVETTPEVEVKVVRLNYADAEDVSDMINDLIGNSSSSKSSTSKNPNQNARNGHSSNITRSTPGAAAPQRQSVNQRSGEAKTGELSKDNCTVLADKRINGLVVMCNKDVWPAVKEIIERMDVKLSQVLIETAIVEVTLGDDIQTGVDWVQRGRERKSERDVDRDGNQRYYLTRTSTSASGDPITSLTDTRMTHAEFDASGLSDLGYAISDLAAWTTKLNRNAIVNNGNYALGGGGGTAASTLASLVSAGFGVATNGASPIGAGINYLLKSDKLNIAAVIQASKSDSHTKYVASPIVMTVDNKEATIEATQMRYLLKGYTYSGSTYNGTTVPDYEQKEIGLTIKVTPKINPNGTVMLTVEEEYSQVGENQAIQANVGGDTTSTVSVPTTVTRKMSADISLDNMQTVVLGGLTEKSISESETGIPILKDIPWIGKWLFGSTSYTEGRKELLVFMTPYVLDDAESAQAEALRRKNAMSDVRPWDDGGWSASQLADPVAKKEILRRLKEEAKKRDEDRETKLAIEKWKLDRAKALEKMTAEERKFWIEQHRDELEDEDKDAFDERVEGYTQEDLKELAKSIREEKLGKAGEEIKADDANARKKEEE